MWTRRDTALAVGLALLAASTSFLGSGLIGERIGTAAWHNVWFDADASFVYSNMTNVGSYHRTSKHPLFSALLYPPVKALSLAGLSKFAAVRLVLAANAAIWIALVYGLLRSTRRSPLDATAFSGLALASAAFLFFAPVPETHLFGSTTILFALYLVAAHDRLRFTTFWSYAANVLTLAMTTTNWMAGIASTLAMHKFRRAMFISIGALALVALVAVAQTRFLKTTGVFFKLSVVESELKWVNHEQAGGVIDRWRAFFWHSMLIPEIREEEIPLASGRAIRMLSVQASSQGDSVTLWTIGILAWCLLLAAGSFFWWTSREAPAYRACLGFVLAGQLLLHTLYGYETFLFAPHFAVLLILLASWATESRFRPGVLVTAGILVLVAMANNSIAFRSACQMLASF